MKEFLYRVATDQADGLLVGLVKIILWILSGLYWTAIKVHGWLFTAGVLKANKLNQPVVSVGNITVGGSGKTPLVEWLAAQIQGQNKRPLILTRGYMGQGGVDENSDEAAMLKESLKDVPVVIGRDRYQSAVRFLSQGTADIFLLDDGFQHRALARSLDIVVIDAANPWGNGHLLPRGTLREPLTHLKRADILVLTKADSAVNQIPDIKKKLAEIAPGKFVAQAIHKPRDLINLRTKKSLELGSLKGKSIAAFCSIGQPDSFYQTLQQLGAAVKIKFPFMDHHVYQDSDIKKMVDASHQGDIEIFVTTHKDAVKLDRLVDNFPSRSEIYYLKIALEITQGKDELLQRIIGFLRP